MFDERLPTRVWVEALVRRAQLGGAAAFVLQKGEDSRGDVLLKVANLQGQAHAYVPRTTIEGERIFVDLAIQGVGPEEASVDSYLRRARERDRDLWIIEIEDREARHFHATRIRDCSRNIKCVINARKSSVPWRTSKSPIL